ncbi:hypothetical protein OIU77_030738 [Salix suchowensis]|uniref:Uncharacterized protein n=1 Tax=Salix suchowensis TaxID=1278906 RepID=A0ABQ9BER2_9ROSI|nr:hypothetical protein OIU77_030738 [Salix suchowensis]
MKTNVLVMRCVLTFDFTMQHLHRKNCYQLSRCLSGLPIFYQMH